MTGIPAALNPLWANIPQELRDLPQWVCWRKEPSDRGKFKKVPVNAKDRTNASVIDAASWSDFAATCDAAATWGCDGVGFVFTDGDAYAGIDIDDPGDDAEQQTFCHQVQTAFNSYTEWSPSGRGLHIIIRANARGTKSTYGVEIYSTARFFTFTGNVFAADWHKGLIKEHQAAVTELEEKLQPPSKLPTGVAWDAPQTATDAQILDRMFNSAIGSKVRDWYNGKPTGIKGDTSGSGIDQALVNAIQHETQNLAQIHRIWLDSLHGQNPARRRKIEGAYYSGRTIRKAFDKTMQPIDMTAFLAKLAATVGSVVAVAGPVLNGAVPTVADTLPGPHGTALGAVAMPGQASGAGTGAAPALALPDAPAAARPARRKAAGRPDPYTLPPGLLGEVASFIYAQANRQVREIALAGAIGWMAGVCGRAYNVEGDGLNMYIALLASSGTGKEAISNGYGALLDALITTVPCIDEFIGPANFASPQGLLRFVSERKSAVSVIGEFGGWIADMVGKRANPVRVDIKDVLLELFGKSGRRGVYRSSVYSDAKNNIASVASPALSIVGETTPSTFYRNITQAVIEDGFVPRLVLIEYEGATPYINKNAANAVLPEGVLTGLAQLAAYALLLNAPGKDGGGRQGPVNVGATYDAAVTLDNFSKYCTDQSNATDNEGIKNIWNRVYMNALKLAALVAVGCHHAAPVITIEHATWAINLVAHSVDMLISKVQAGDVAGSDEAAQYNNLLRCLKEVPQYSQQRADAYRLTHDMAKAGYVNTAWLNDRVAKLGVYVNDKVGPAIALRKVLLRASDEKLLTLDDFVAKHRLGGTTYKIAPEFLASADWH